MQKRHQHAVPEGPKSTPLKAFYRLRKKVPENFEEELEFLEIRDTLKIIKDIGFLELREFHEYVVFLTLSW